MNKFIFLIFFLLALPGQGIGKTRVLFSHQSVGRYVVADPERAAPSKRASAPMRDFLNPNVAFWDHDYYNYWTNDLINALLDPEGNNWPINTGFGGHRGTSVDDIVMNHLLGEAFTDTPTELGKAFRDSCVSRFDIVMIKAGYHDLHMNTASSLSEYQAMFNTAADWWHNYNLEHGTKKVLVVMTSSSLRHPSDYSGGDSSWPDTPAGHAEAEADAAVYHELDLWLKNVWSHRYQDSRYFSTWWFCVNDSGDPTQKFFTKDIYSGSGAGDSSGDHHLNIAGSDALQAVLVDYINGLVNEFEGTSGIEVNPPKTVFQLHNATPNPFNPSTMLSFDLLKESAIRLSIFDISGNHIKTLLAGTRPAGLHQILWDGKNRQGTPVPSGVYFYKIEAGPLFETKRMVLVR